MIRVLAEWLRMRWQPRQEANALAQAYLMTFSTVQGKMVLEDLLTQFYFQVYEGNDPIGMAQHNATRQVIQGILENMDAAEFPNKRRYLEYGLDSRTAS